MAADNECSQRLHSYIQNKVQKHPGYSLRAVARDLQISPAYLSLVVNGQKKLNLKRIKAFALYFELSQEETIKFQMSAIKVKLGAVGSSLLEECLVK